MKIDNDELFYYRLLKESERLFIQLPKDKNGHTDFSELQLLINKKRVA